MKMLNRFMLAGAGVSLVGAVSAPAPWGGVCAGLTVGLMSVSSRLTAELALKDFTRGVIREADKYAAARKQGLK